MAKNDFLLNIGFKIDTKSIQKGVLRKALNKAAEGLTLKIAKVKLSNPQQMRKEIARQLGSVQLSNLSVSSNAAKALSRSIADKTRPTIKGLTLNPTALSNLRKSVERALSNVQVSVAGIQSGGGQRRSSGGGAAQSNTRATQAGAAAAESRKEALLRMARAERKAYQEMTNAERATVRSAQTFKQAGVSVDELGVKVGQVTKRFTEYAASVALVRATQQTFRLAAQGVAEFDSAVQDLAKVGSVTKDIDKGFTALSSVALNTGRSIQDVSDAVGEFVRQGKNLEEATKAANNALQLSNISTLNGADAARIVTASQQIFGSTAEELSNQLSSLAVFADSSATNVTEIGQAFLRAGSSAKIGGFTLEETFATLAATLEQTRLQSATVGTALKTIVARLGRDRKKVADLANSFLGVTEGQKGFVDSSGTVKQILDQLGENFGRLTLAQKQQLALSVAGVRQGNVFIGMLDNFAKSQELANNAQTDSSAINEKNQKQLEKLTTRFTNLQTSVKAFGGAIAGLEGGDQGGIAGITSALVGGLTQVVSIIPKTVSGLNNLSEGFNIGTTVSTAAIGAVLGVLRNVASVAASAFRQFVGFGNAAQEASKKSVQGLNQVDQNQKRNNQTLRETNEELKRQVSLRQRLVGIAGKGVAGVRKNGGKQVVGPEGSDTNAAGGAVRGAALFAGLDIANQVVGNFSASIDETIERLKEQSAQTDNLVTKQKLLEQIASERAIQDGLAGAQAGVTAGAMAFFAGATKKGAISIGLFVGALSLLLSSLQKVREELDELDKSIVKNQLSGQFFALNARLKESAKLISAEIREKGELADASLRASQTIARFADAVQEARNVEERVTARRQAELSGVSGRFAGAQRSELELRQRFSGSEIRSTGGQSLSIDQALEADPASLLFQATKETTDIYNESNKSLLNLRAEFDKNANEFGTFVNALKYFSDNLVGTIDEFKNELAPGTELVTKAFKELSKNGQASASAIEQARLTLANQANDIKFFQDDSIGKAVARFITGLGDGATAENLQEQLGAEITKFNRAFDESGKQVAEAMKDAAEATDGLSKQIEKEEKQREGDFVKLRVARQKQASIIEQSSKFLEQQERFIQRETFELAEKQSLEARTNALRKQGFEGQKAAIVLTNRFNAANSKLVQEAEERARTAGRGDDDPQLRAVRAAAQQQADARSRFEIAQLERAEAEKNLETLQQKLADTEGKRSDALSKLQNAQKNVLSAEKKVSEANRGLADAFLEVASAQQRLNEAVVNQAKSVNSAVKGALSSAGFERVSNVGSALNQIVNLEERLALIRREGLEQSLRIAQEQANTLFSIGERLATGGPGARAEIQRGLSVAQSIQGGAGISQFAPQDIALALQTADLFPGLREEISRQSLASVGLEDELNLLRGTISGGTETATRLDTNDSVRIAQAQLSATLKQIDQAELAKRNAEEDLTLSRNQVASAQQGLDLARNQVSIQQGLLSEASRQTKRLDDLASFTANSNGFLRNTGSSQPAGSSRSRFIQSQSQSSSTDKELIDTYKGTLDELVRLKAQIDNTSVKEVQLQIDTNKIVRVAGIEGLGQKLRSELEGQFASNGEIDAVETAILDIVRRLNEAGLSDDLGR